MVLPEILAALAALCWAVGSLFSANASSSMGAFAFTRWRLFFALTLLWVLAAFTGQWRSLDGPAVGLLVVSGLIGIFIGDTALFACMNRLGPRRSGVIFATHALFSAVLAWAKPSLFKNSSITSPRLTVVTPFLQASAKEPEKAMISITK